MVRRTGSKPLDVRSGDIEQLDFDGRAPDAAQGGPASAGPPRATCWPPGGLGDLEQNRVLSQLAPANGDGWIAPDALPRPPERFRARAGARIDPTLPPSKRENMKQEMLINVSQPEECRIAIVEDGVLEELYIERTSQDNYVGNIYKGRIVNLEPSIQAAFVDFGVGRNGFLHISDVEPQYFRQGGYDPDQPVDRRPSDRAADAGSCREERRRRRRRVGPRARRTAAAAPARAPHQAAHPGHLPPRRRSAGPGHQGGDRHQGADAVDLHQHPRPLPGADAGAGAGGRLAQDRRRRRPAASSARHDARTEPAQGPGVHRPHRRPGTDEERAFP